MSANFQFDIRDNELTLILNRSSYFVKIDQIGLRRCNTGSPQYGVDYDKSNGDTKPIIIGIGMI